ncbi:hypothetical protein SNEBB_005308 [Seison nebaliae]|nr:hypothetical protein SNEBB_005308 [Seison nebaliae]
MEEPIRVKLYMRDENDRILKRTKSALCQSKTTFSIIQSLIASAFKLSNEFFIFIEKKSWNDNRRRRLEKCSQCEVCVKCRWCDANFLEGGVDSDGETKNGRKNVRHRSVLSQMKVLPDSTIGSYRRDTNNRIINKCECEEEGNESNSLNCIDSIYCCHCREERRMKNVINDIDRSRRFVRKYELISSDDDLSNLFKNMLHTRQNSGEDNKYSFILKLNIFVENVLQTLSAHFFRDNSDNSSGTNRQSSDNNDDMWDYVQPIDIANAHHQVSIYTKNFLGTIATEKKRAYNYMKSMFNALSPTASTLLSDGNDGLILSRLINDELIQTDIKQTPLDDSEWKDLQDKDGRILDEKKLRNIIFHRGVSKNLRKVVWRLLLNLFPSKFTGQERMERMKCLATKYEQIKRSWQKKEVRESWEAKKIIEQLEIDVERTDRNSKFYSGINNSNIGKLKNILTTYIFAHPTQNYWQGMSDYASVVLYVMRKESDAYISFCAMMRRCRSNVKDDVWRLRLKHISFLLKYFDIDLFDRLEEDTGEKEIFLIRWLLLECRREFLLEDWLDILDVMLSRLPFNSMTDNTQLQLNDDIYRAYDIGWIFADLPKLRPFNRIYNHIYLEKEQMFSSKLVKRKHLINNFNEIVNNLEIGIDSTCRLSHHLDNDDFNGLNSSKHSSFSSNDDNQFVAIDYHSTSHKDHRDNGDDEVKNHKLFPKSKTFESTCYRSVNGGRFSLLASNSTTASTFSVSSLQSQNYQNANERHVVIGDHVLKRDMLTHINLNKRKFCFSSFHISEVDDGKNDDNGMFNRERPISMATNLDGVSNNGSSTDASTDSSSQQILTTNTPFPPQTITSSSSVAGAPVNENRTENCSDVDTPLEYIPLDELCYGNPFLPFIVVSLLHSSREELLELGKNENSLKCENISHLMQQKRRTYSSKKILAIARSMYMHYVQCLTHDKAIKCLEATHWSSCSEHSSPQTTDELTVIHPNTLSTPSKLKGMKKNENVIRNEEKQRGKLIHEKYGESSSQSSAATTSGSSDPNENVSTKFSALKIELQMPSISSQLPGHKSTKVT